MNVWLMLHSPCLHFEKRYIVVYYAAGLSTQNDINLNHILLKPYLSQIPRESRKTAISLNYKGTLTHNNQLKALIMIRKKNSPNVTLI